MKVLKCLLLTNKIQRRKQLIQHIQTTESVQLLQVCYTEEDLIQYQEEPADLVFLDKQYLQNVAGKFLATHHKPMLINLDDIEISLPDFAYPCKSLTSMNYEHFLKLIISAWIHFSYQQEVKKQKYLFIKSDYKLIKLCLDDILFCEGMKDYTQIFLQSKLQPLVTLQNLKALSAKLPEAQFIRIHRSYLISINHIDEISKSEVAIGKKLIPVGNNYRSELFKFVEANS